MPNKTVGNSDNVKSYLIKSDGTKIAYHKLSGAGPGIIFFGGFASDMEGTKALALQAHAARTGQSFLRFDYQGHGKSSGSFSDGTIGKWLSDSLSILDEKTEGPQILVGSSMGGWISLLAARERVSRVAGLIGIASAPDFTEDLMWSQFDDNTKQILRKEGKILMVSEYDNSPSTITMNLIEDGRKYLVLREELPLEIPIRLIHGMADNDVPYELSVRLANHIDSQNVEVTLIKDGDHRLSKEQDLVTLLTILDTLTSKLLNK